MTNILYIIEEFVLGGAERVVADQALNIDKEKFNVTVCCLRKKGEFAHLLQEKGVRIIELGKKPGVDFSIIPKVKRVIKENHIQLVHTHLWVANFWGRIAAILSGVPVVITEHNVDIWKRWYHKFADWFLAFFTKKVCVVSRQVGNFYRKECWISKRKIEVVYNGIDIARREISKEEIKKLRNQLKFRDDRPLIVSIGRLVEAKAVHVFIESCQILVKRGCKFKALIVGEGPLRERLQQSVRRLGLEKKVIFTGLRKDVDKILELADVCVLSSVREGLPITVLEAMAHGVPFVATDVGGNSEVIVDGETGFLVPINDVEALAYNIEKILQDSGLRMKLSANAKKRVEELFSVEKMVKRYEEIYKVGSKT